MNLLTPFECHHCGVVDEAQYVFSGPHIKQICGSCGAYVKFVSKASIPDAREIKLKIWSITKQNLEIIDNAKQLCGFVEGLNGIEKNIMYWRLYRQIRALLQSRKEVHND